MTALLALVASVDVLLLAHGAWARRHDSMTLDERATDDDDDDDELDLQVVPRPSPPADEEERRAAG